MKFFIVTLAAALFVSCGTKNGLQPTVELQNPIIPGYFADPTIVEHDGKFYLYVTADPWGADFLSCWVSDNFRDWTFQTLNWPTKEACTSPASNENKVWAPSVVKKGGLFYMYVSVGSEVWCGKAKHPLGPWENILGDKPMIAYDQSRFYHVIDAEAFIDTDGKSYLYWGSGWDWINGHCFAAELNDDMSSFKSAPVEVTPSNYFEGPFMVKHNDKYFLTYSDGKTIDDTYKVRYAVGDSPFGPFKEAGNSPILKTSHSLQTFGPGHHSVFPFDGKNYVLYHKHSLPFPATTVLRQVCINEMPFDEAGNEITTIIPYDTQSFPNLAKKQQQYIPAESLTASSQQSDDTLPEYAADNHYGTRWEASDEDTTPSLSAGFKGKTSVDSLEIRFEYPWKTYFVKIESSSDGNSWQTVADYSDSGISGSPVLVGIHKEIESVRIVFVRKTDDPKPSVWELRFY